MQSGVNTALKKYSTNLKTISGKTYVTNLSKSSKLVGNLVVKDTYSYEPSNGADGTWRETSFYFFHYDGQTFCIEHTIIYTRTSGDTSEETYAVVYYSDSEISAETIASATNTTLSEGSYILTGSIADELSDIISSWYYRLLVIAAVGMLSVLVYIGIRILISSTAPSKAKYKQMLGDWVVGMVLLFSMHFIMVFANTFVDLFTDFLSSTAQGGNYVWIQDTNNKIQEALEDKGFTLVEATSQSEAEAKAQSGDYSQVLVYRSGATDYVLWTTNSIGQLRIDLQAYTDSAWDYIGYTIMYVMMIIYLGMFTIVYLKRIILLAFLTLIAPLVALTYPIDKANDGSAQGFNYWFKEYMFNLLLQPIHLLLYTVLVTSALDLALEHPLYAIVALGFMVPAEKILRQMFNFGKASTPGVFGGVAGAAVVMSGMRWLTGHGPNPGKDNKSGGDGKERDSDGNLYVSTGRDKVTLGSGVEGTPDTGSESTDGGDGSGGSNGNFKLPEGTEDDYDNSDTNTNDNLNLDDKDYNQYFNFDDNQNNGGAKGSLDSSYGANGRKWIPGDTSDGRDSSEGRTGDVPKIPQLDKGKEHTDEDKGKSKKRKIKTHSLKAIGAAGNYWGHGMAAKAQKAKRDLRNAKPVKKMVRMAGGAAGAAALGMVGLAAGATTGDFAKAAQYAGVGLAGGYKLGSNTTGAAANAVSVEGTREEFRRNLLGEKEYQEKMAKQTQAMAMHDTASIRKIQEKFKISELEAQKKWKEMVPFYYNNKVTNIDDMIKMERAKDLFMQKKGMDENKARDASFQAWHINNRYSLENNMGRAKQNAVISQMVQDTANGEHPLDEAKARTIVTDYAPLFREANLGLR